MLYNLKRGVIDKTNIEKTVKILYGILSGKSSTESQHIQQIGMSNYTCRTIITLPRRLRKSYRPFIVYECSYSIFPMWKYSEVWKGYTGEVVLVGINYDKDKKDAGHSCKIERVNYPADCVML